MEPPKDQDRPDFKKETGLAVGVVKDSVWDFLFNFQSSCELRSAEEGAVEALLCREELSVELVFVVFEDPLPLVERVSTVPTLCSIFLRTSMVKTRDMGYQGDQVWSFP